MDRIKYAYAVLWVRYALGKSFCVPHGYGEKKENPENNRFRVPIHFGTNRFKSEKFPPPPPLLHPNTRIHMWHARTRREKHKQWWDKYVYVYRINHVYIYVYVYIRVRVRTGWRRLTGSPKLQVISRKRATKYRSLLQKMTYKDKGSFESSPPCTLVCIVCIMYPYTYIYVTHILQVAWGSDTSYIYMDTYTRIYIGILYMGTYTRIYVWILTHVYI